MMFLDATSRLVSYYQSSLNIVAPCNKKELKELYVLVRENALHKTTPIMVWNAVKAVVGAYPYIQYRLADLYKSRDDKRTERALARKEHRLRQKAWWHGGVREEHYLQKYGRYGGDHLFLTNRISQFVGANAGAYEEQWDEEPTYECDWVTPTQKELKRAQKWCRYDCTSDARQRAYIRAEIPAPTRSVVLLYKIRALQKALRNQSYAQYASVAALTTKSANARKNSCEIPRMSGYNAEVDAVTITKSANARKPIYGMPQMEGRTGEELNTVLSENVVLTEENSSSMDISANVKFTRWHEMCTTDSNEDYRALLDRWTYWKSFEWNDTHLSGQEIVAEKCDLPYDFVYSVAENGSMPMFVPFKIYRYMKSDIEIKIHVNSNKFQVGQLQFSWQYMEKFDGNKLNNMYSRSQLPHILVNAGASNEATLVIPYVYIEPFMSTHQRRDEIDCLYLGTLRCFVTSRLSTGTNGPKSCGVSYFVKFPNAVFTGLRDGSIAEPQMMAAAGAMVAAKVYDKMIGDVNCDKPTQNTNPQYVIPTGTHPWAAGKGISDQLMSLRLDGSVRGVGRPDIQNSETNIGIPCRVFGMLQHFYWDATEKSKNVSGYPLYSIDVHPQLEESCVYSQANPGNMTSYAYPPVSVISGLYKYWRGSLEFKFDIIASMFHTGRLLCAYIPGIFGSTSKITLEQARNSPHIEFSLQDATSFTFVVPYISDRVWWSRRYTGPHKYNEINAPSRLVMFVLNPLVPMQDVINKVEIIPYVRAGTDFEVSVPVQPSFGLSDNTSNVITAKNMIYPTAGSYPMRATNYEGFGEDKYYIYYEGTAAFGTASTFHAPEDNKEKSKPFYGSFQYPTKTGSMKYVSQIDGALKNAQIGYIVLWGTKNGNYGIPFPYNTEGKSYAIKLAKALFQKKSEADCLTFCYGYQEDGNESSNDFGLLQAVPTLIDDNGFEFIGGPEMERIESTNVLQPTAPLSSTSSGSFNFNEEFNDLKDLARRYQLYASGSFTIKSDFNSGDAVLVFPVIPHGLDLDIHNKDKIFNNCRDGHIPLISSGYTYFRGSIRFKMVVQTNQPVLAVSSVRVQHHPDGDCIPPVVQTYPNITDEDNFNSHSYGFYIQNANVNNIVELEIPFYQPGMYGLTRKASSTDKKVCKYRSLGNVTVSLTCPPILKDGNVTYQIYYSIGDDFSFNVFRGFPMVVRTDEVWPSEVMAPVKKRKEIVRITGAPEMMDAQPEMMSAISKRLFGTTPTEKIFDITKHMKETVTSQLKECIAEVKEASNDLSENMNFGLKSHFVISAIGNLAHIINNPQPGTIAISLANVIIGYIGHSFLSLITLSAALRCVLYKHWSKFTGEAQAAPISGNPESDISLEHISLGSLIFTGVCGMFGVAFAGPKRYPDIIRNINSTVSLTNNITRLLQNCSDLILYCIKYVISKLYPATALAAKFSEDVPTIKLWYEECVYLMDSRVRSRYLYDKSMMSRVYDACVTGSLLIMKGMDKSSPAGRIVCDTYKEIRKIRNDLFERGVHPDVRFEVYPLWISGEAGIGKSFMVKRLINDLLRSVDYSAPGSLIYDIPSGAKYWSGCTNPAALVSDDIFQVGGTRREEELANLFMICSSSVLNPPMAAVEDKEKRINPLIYMMLCNSHFPELQPMVSTPEAVYRRRKFLLYARLNPQLKETIPNFRDASQVPRDILDKMGHLEFRYAFNVRDPSTQYSEWMPYENILELIRTDFKRHYENEQRNFRQRMIDMYSLDPEFRDTNIIMEMPELADKISLDEQIELYKEKIKMKAAMVEDPQDKDAWTYIRKFLTRFNIIRNEHQMEEPNTTTQPAELYKDESIAKLEQLVDDVQNLETPGLKDMMLAEYPDFLDKIKNLHSDLSHLLVNTDDSDPNLHKVIDELPFVFMTPFKNFNATSMTLRLKNVVRQWANEFNPKDDYHITKIKEMMSFGNFSLLELMRFIATTESGHIDLATVLYKVGVPLCNDPLFSNVSSDMVREEIAKVTPLYDYCPKDPARINLRHMRYGKPCTLRGMYLDSVFDISGLRERCEKISPTYYSQGIMRFFVNSKTGIESSLEFMKIMDKVGADDGSRAVPILCEAYAMSLLADVIYGNHFFCSTHLNYNFIIGNNAKTKYCAISNKLTYDGEIINQCTFDCLYNNDFLYFYLAEISISCLNVTYKSRETGSLRKEISEINYALLKRKTSRVLTLFDKFKEWFKCLVQHKIPIYMTKFVRFLVESVPILISMIAAVTVGYGVKKMTGWSLPTSGLYDLMRMNKEYDSPQGNYYKVDQTAKLPVRSGMNLSPKSFVKPQMSMSNRKNIAKIIERNFVMLYASWIDNGNRRTASCTNLMVGGRTMLTLRHYLEEYKALVDEGFVLELSLYFNKGKDGMCSTSICWKDLYGGVQWCVGANEEITSNFGLIELPKSIPIFKDITKRIATIPEHKNSPSRADLYVLNGDSSFDIPICVKNNFTVCGTRNSSEVQIDSVYSYNRQYKGLCGSLLVAPTLGSGSGAIIGVHVAGNSGSGVGFAEPLYQELFDEYFQKVKKIEVMEVPTSNEIEPVFDLDANLMMYGTVDPKFSKHQSGKSQIVPSLLHGEIYPVRTQIAPLSPNDPRQPAGSHPLKDGCEKHGSGDVRVFDSELVKQTTTYMSDLMTQIVRPIRATISPLSLQQAVCGDVNVPYFEALNWKSSEGFPLSAHRPSDAHDKRWLFNMTEGKDGYVLKSLHPLLSSQLRMRDVCFERNIKPPTVYVDCLKDARLPPEKCATPGKTRIFSVAPIQCSIDIRRHLNDFCASVKNSRIKNSIAIGINPDSVEWTQLVNYLLEVGTKIITLDYSNYGPCLMSQLVAAGNDVIVNWHKNHDADVKHCERVDWLLDCDILNPVHLTGNIVYQTLNGISSGSPLTAECNSIPNLFYIRLTWLEIMKEHFPQWASNYFFDFHVRLVVYGDDLIMSVSDDASSLFNALTIQEYLWAHGIKVTSAQKDAALQPFGDITQATFLKRGFKSHPYRKGIWLAPMDTNSIEECINWVHRSDNIQEATLECCRASLDLAYSQGPEYYKQHSEKLRKYLNKHLNLSIRSKTWHQRDAEIFGESGSTIAPSVLHVRVPLHFGEEKTDS